jgi:hypothetical protein
MRRIVLVLALALSPALALSLSACSFVFVSGPPPQHEQLPYFKCTESRVAPVLDIIFAVLQGANFLVAAGSSDERWAENFDGDPPIERTTAVPLYAIATLLGAGGAYYGFTRTGACRSARSQAFVRGQRGNFGQPPTWPPPQGPYAPPGGHPPAPAPTPYPPTQAPAPTPDAPQAPQPPYGAAPVPPSAPPPAPPPTPPPPPSSPQ